MKKLSVVLVIGISLFKSNYFLGSVVGDNNTKENVMQNSKESMLETVFRNCKKNCIEAFIFDSDDAKESQSKFGKKIEYRNGVVVLQQKDRSILYKENVLYIFDINGNLEKEIGR